MKLFQIALFWQMVINLLINKIFQLLLLFSLFPQGLIQGVKVSILILKIKFVLLISFD